MFQNQGIFNYRLGSLVDFCEGSFDNCNIISSTKVFRVSESETKIYPNPASNSLNLIGNERIERMTMINLKGQVVYEDMEIRTSGKELDISSFLMVCILSI